MQTRTAQEMMWRKLVGLHLREKGERGVELDKLLNFFVVVERVQ